MSLSASTRAIANADAGREDELIPVLLVTPNEEDRTMLEKILCGPSWCLLSAASCSEALLIVQSMPVPVVICERVLPDGDWQALLKKLGPKTTGLSLIVVSRIADERLWAKVLNLGGYDVLLTPFEEIEVLRVADSARRSAAAFAA